MFHITDKSRKMKNSKSNGKKINNSIFDKPDKKFSEPNKHHVKVECFNTVKEIKKEKTLNPNKIFEGLEITKKTKKKKTNSKKE